MDAIHVIKRPLITEKSTWHSQTRNRYSFEVAINADKPAIRSAIEELYGVRVQHVATQIRKGQWFRNRFGAGRKPNWKRAIVQLHDDDRIELF